MANIAAIDVGSNAMRMVVGAVEAAGQVRTLENIRLPVRLGGDVFSNGVLEEKTIQQTEEAFLRFRRMAEDFNVQYLRAVATSAAREAENRDLLLERVFRTSGIEIEIISGEEEARLIHLAVAHKLKLENKRSLLIDIGGGSIEVTLSTGRSIISTDSINLGTVRLLETWNANQASKHTFGDLVREATQATRERIQHDLGDKKVQVCVGTGGNVEALGRLRRRLFKAESNRCISLAELEKLIERLDQMTYKERIRKWKLRPDRADVILPASMVLHWIASETGVKYITIPHVGLKDGILVDLIEDLGKNLQLQRRERIWESALPVGCK